MKGDVSKLRQDIVFEADLRERRFIFHSTWGLFSPTEIDEGSRLLLDHLKVRPGDLSLDIGCGYGALGIPMAKLSPQGEVHMIDKDFVAVDYAKKNMEVNGVKNAKVYLSNGFSNVPGVKFDLIVSNLPAKVGREFLWILLEDAKAYLKPGGRICVVTISGLREFVKRNFRDVFGNYEKVKQGRAYTVGMAIKMRESPRIE
jgi:16S rRNA G1207 methylase RsmC